LHHFPTIRPIFGPSKKITPNFEGGYKGYFLNVSRMTSWQVIWHHFSSIRPIFGPSKIFTPKLGVLLQGVVNIFADFEVT